MKKRSLKEKLFLTLFGLIVIVGGLFGVIATVNNALPYHPASQVSLTNGKDLQQAINDGSVVSNKIQDYSLIKAINVVGGPSLGYTVDGGIASVYVSSVPGNYTIGGESFEKIDSWNWNNVLTGKKVVVGVYSTDISDGFQLYLSETYTSTTPSGSIKYGPYISKTGRQNLSIGFDWDSFATMRLSP